jgi:NADPH-dependent 2,4-dienoyl-CoA reductase/sulfur reductase-like enzyme
MAMSRIIIVGAGPAGIRAAEALVAAGLVPVVIDEAAAAGGQIYRQPPPGFTRSPATLYGSEARKATALHARFAAMLAAGQLEHLPQSAVLAIGDGTLQVLTPAGVQELSFDRLILCTGAGDRVMPVPGWEAPGVFTLGAAQIALKAQGVALGQRMVLAGSGPLLTLVAAQLLKAGARVEAVLDTAPMRHQIAALPGLIRRPLLTLRGLMLRATLGRRYHAGVQLGVLETDANGPVALNWTDAAGRARRSLCDTLALGWHLRAETHLADLAGCKMLFDPVFRQSLPLLDAIGRSSRTEIYLAGDGARLAGADAAEISGRLAAQACLQDLGQTVQVDPGDARRLRRYTRFAHALARAFPFPPATAAALPDATVICRCEAITLGTLRATAAAQGAAAGAKTGTEMNRCKSLSRVGMGRCQGRYCALAAAEILARETGVPLADLGHLRPQAPARPVQMGNFLPR